MDEAKRQDVFTEFGELVNMSPKEIENWLDTDQSQSVGMTNEGEDESTGHKSGRRIVEIRHTRKADLSDDDYEHMQKVVGYIKRHSKQRPKGDVEDTDWRFSLMNWGHDPLKK